MVTSLQIARVAPNAHEDTALDQHPASSVRINPKGISDLDSHFYWPAMSPDFLVLPNVKCSICGGEPMILGKAWYV